MPEFPILKTGAVAQYPLTRELRLQNQTLRFVGGTQQRYRDSGSTRLRWVIQLSLLDEGELAAVEEFFLTQEGGYGSFTFTDPWDGVAYEECRLESDELGLLSSEEMQGETTVTVIR
jgi:hypothetical protein